MVGVTNNAPGKVFSFVRQAGGHRIFAVINFSAEPQAVRFEAGPHHGRYRDFDGGGEVVVAAGTEMRLAPWSYRLLTAGP